MFLKKNNGIWFYGVSGSGKTIASQYLKKRIRNSFLIDGDVVRKYISFDLGYSIRDRKTQVKRVLGIAKISRFSKIFPIISTVFMSQNLKNKLKEERILVIKIIRDFKKIKNRKKIYNKKMNYVIGIDIKNPKLKKESIIDNNSTKQNLYKKLEKIIYER